MKRRTGQFDQPCLLYASQPENLQYQNDAVELEKRDGTTVDVELDTLCSEDQDFVRERKWKEAEKGR